MSAYLIGQIQVTDLERYKEYMKASPGVNEKFGGRFIVRGGERVTLEGPEETRRIVVIESEPPKRRPRPRADAKAGR